MNALARIDAEAATPSEICSVVQSKRRAVTCTKTKKSTPSASVAKRPPCAGNTHTDDGHDHSATQALHAVVGSRPWEADHTPLAHYDPAPYAGIIDQIVYLHRRRQNAIKAKTKMILSMKAEVRSILCSDSDFEEDKSATKLTAFGKKPRKLTKSAMKRVDDALNAAKREIAAAEEAASGGDAPEPLSDIAGTIVNFVRFEEAQEKVCNDLAKQMVKLVKMLPIYGWAKSITGFGDTSLATIIGECGDIGTYKSVSAVWKRLGLAVDKNGRRQGAPGEGATAQDWVDHGYNRARRSVSWNMRTNLIGSMGKWRPLFGSNLGDATYFQRLYAERARLEAMKLGKPVAEKLNDKGELKESYDMHVANRAHRYVEKRLLKHLYLEWRRA